MITLNCLSDYKSNKKSAVTIGKYDGVHKAHQMLINKTVEYAKINGLQSVVCSFDFSSTGILTWKEKEEMLESMGVDILIRCPFDTDLITTPAEKFIEDLLETKLGTSFLCIGYDFRFGYGRTGDENMLRDKGHFELEVLPKQYEGDSVISSTSVRAYLDEGRVDEASKMLGYEYFMTGTVVHGRQLGRTIGVPTANIIPDRDKYLPLYGVYTSKTIFDNIEHEGITNIGVKPTVDGTFPGSETYLFDIDEDMYGQYQKTKLYSFIRKERKFDSVEDLKKQLDIDINIGKSCFDNC